MKVKVVVFLTLAIFAAIGGVGLAQAQKRNIARARVPFDFYAGGQKMPAGDYIVGVNVLTKMITLGDASGQHRMFLMGIPAEDGYDKSELVFEHRGDAYALQEVKSDLIDLTLQPRMPEQAVESRLESTRVEIALNR